MSKPIRGVQTYNGVASDDVVVPAGKTAYVRKIVFTTGATPAPQNITIEAAGTTDVYVEADFAGAANTTYTLDFPGDGLAMPGMQITVGNGASQRWMIYYDTDKAGDSAFALN